MKILFHNIKAGALLLLLAGVLFNISLLQAQEIKEDLRRIHEAYQQIKSYSVDIEQRVYPTFEAQQSIHLVTGKIRIAPDRYYSSIDGVELLQNDDYAIQVNHDNKTIIVQASMPLMEPQLGIPNLDSLLSLCSNVQFKKLSAKAFQYDLFFEEMEYARMRLVFNPKSWHIDQLVLYYAGEDKWGGSETETQARVEIQFRNGRFNPDIPPATFYSQRFFKAKSGDFTLQPAYASFRLYNYLR